MLTFRLAWRNLWRNPRRTIILWAAICLSVAGILFTTAYINAYMIQLEDNQVAYVLGDVQIHAKGFFDEESLDHRFTLQTSESEKLQQIPGLKAWSRRLRTYGLVSTAHYSTGLEIIGVDPASEALISRVPIHLSQGRYLKPGDGPVAFIGTALAEKLETKLGRKIVLMCSDVNGEVASDTFTVVGLFTGPTAPFEKSVVYIPLQSAQKFMGIPDSITDIVCKTSEHTSVEELAAQLNPLFDRNSFEIITWKQMAPALVQMMSLFDQSMFILYAVIFIAMSFVITNSFLMAVMERIREFGLMKAMGARPAQIVWMVLSESLILGFSGALCGLLLGGGIALYFNINGLDLSFFKSGAEFFGVSSIIYPTLHIYDYFFSGVAGFLITVLVTLYPAIKGSRFNTIKALNYV